MKWKSLEAVEIISPKKKKGLIAKTHQYENYLVIDIYKDGGHYGRYAMDLDTGEYGFRKGEKTHRWKLPRVFGVKEYEFDFHWTSKIVWDTEKDRLAVQEILKERSIGFEIDRKESQWVREKRKRALELKYNRIWDLMDRMPPEPEHMYEWILEHFADVYFFLDETKKNSKCPVCQKEFPRKELVKVSGEGMAKNNDLVECPHCSIRGVLKVRKTHIEQHGQVLVFQKLDEKQNVARRFAWTAYNRYGHRGCYLDETIRIMMYVRYAFEQRGGYKIYYDQGGEHTNWYTGLLEPEWNDRNPQNKRALECCLYPEGITEALWGTDYASLSRAFEAMARANIVADYNAAMAVGCKRRQLGTTLEYLTKGRFWNLARETAGRCAAWNGAYYGELDLDGRTIENTFGIQDRQKINRIRQANGGEKMLLWMRYSEKNNEKISQETLQWLMDCGIEPESVEKDLKQVAGKMSIERIRNYLERQSRHYTGDAKDTLEHWADYLNMMAATNKKLDDELFYKPKDLKAAHDALIENRQKMEAVRRMNADPEARKAEAQEMRDKFPEAEAILQDVRKKYSYQGEEYIMRIPEDLVEITEEGYALHHCGGFSERYYNRICNRETYIGFCRKVGEENIPFYTIEFEPDGTIRQNRSYYDEEPDIESIRGFLKEWQREIKKRLNRKDLEYAKKSAVLREQNIQELEAKRNTFVLEKLKEDFMAAG